MGILGMILLILACLIIILVLCLFIKITLDIELNKPREDKLKFNIRLSLLNGVIKKDILLKNAKKSSKDKPDENTDEKFIKKTKSLYNKFLTFKYTLSKVKPSLRKTIKVKEFKLNINFGTDDAFDTGLLTGSLWAGIYNVIAFVSNFVSLTEPQVNVNPDFQNKYLEVNSKVKITLRPINLITLALKFIINYYLIKRKLTKKQEKKEKAAINYANSN